MKNRPCLRAAFVLIALLLLFAAGAAADSRHTFVLQCTGGGFAGRDSRGVKSEILVLPEAGFTDEDGNERTLEEIRALPDFRPEGAALRFTADSVQGWELRYALICGGAVSAPQAIRPGRNLWDVTAVLEKWLEDPAQELRLVPLYDQEGWGVRLAEGSVSLQLTFSAAAEIDPFPMDRVRYNPVYENSLCMLEKSSLFVEYYDDTAGSLMEVTLPLGVPYYYAGGTESKFLMRFFPTTTTHYYLHEHMYLCGLDCVGMTRLVYEKSGLERHPSIVDILRRGVAHGALAGNDPSRWPMLLQPGDLIGVKHGTYHVMMYLGTLRMFGWTEKTAGEAAELLDEPLVIHCGGNPFYYDRYQEYIREMGYKNTYPPDGGVTVSVIRATAADAPRSTDTSWGRHFGWYNMTDSQPLLVFPLDDCTDMAWYGPLQEPRGE